MSSAPFLNEIRLLLALQLYWQTKYSIAVHKPHPHFEQVINLSFLLTLYEKALLRIQPSALQWSWSACHPCQNSLHKLCYTIVMCTLYIVCRWRSIRSLMCQQKTRSLNLCFLRQDCCESPWKASEIFNLRWLLEDKDLNTGNFQMLWIICSAYTLHLVCLCWIWTSRNAQEHF